MPEDARIFDRLKDYPFGMSAHILYPQIDPDVPLTLSRKGFDYIRKNFSLTYKQLPIITIGSLMFGEKIIKIYN